MNEALDSTPPGGAAKSPAAGFRALAGGCRNRYIGTNLWFSYDRVLRVGPSGPALFYYLRGPRPGLDPHQVTPPVR